MPETTASEFYSHAANAHAVDRYDFDQLSGMVQRRWRVDTVTLVAEDGISVFLAERSRFLFRRTAAVVAGILCFAALIAAIGLLTGVFPNGQVSRAGLVIFMLGIVGSLLFGWWLTIRLIPIRPIAVYSDPDSHAPDVLIIPTKRYRLGLPTLAVIEPWGEVIGYLRQENHDQIGWSIADASGRVLFLIERRPGIPTGGFLVWLFVPAIGLLIYLAGSLSRVNATVAILTNDNAYRLGSLTLPPNHRGEITMNLQDDYKRYFPRRLAIAAAVAANLY